MDYQLPEVAAGEPFAPDWQGETIIPRRVVIETVYGCNARCPMCPISLAPKRQQGTMSWDGFCRIVDDLLPHRDRIDMVDLFGLGEPLIDPLIYDRIGHLKRHGFRRLAISTNAQLLSRDRTQRLLQTGIETIIVSIDGHRAETHEAIRRRTDFRRVRDNVETAVALRDRTGAASRFVVRFIHQSANAAEWADYKRHWDGVLSADRGDRVERYDIHGWSGQVGDGPTGDAGAGEGDWVSAMPCHHIFEKMVILADGSMALCFEDIYEAQFGFGNAIERNCIDVFNSPRFNKLRRLHIAGKRGRLKICGACAVLGSEVERGRDRSAAAA